MYANMISITRKIVKLLMVFWAMSGLHAQDSTTGGFRHQGVVRDASGRPLPNMQATLQIVIAEDARMGNALYMETHEVKTGASGEFSITVGEGNPVKGGMQSISWSQEGLWMHVALQAKGSKRSSQVLSSSRLPVVPYAMHAVSTSRIIGAPETEDKEKQQSVYWLTSGNSLTKPATHFLGTRDTASLVFKTNNQTRMTISKEGQVHYKAGSTMTGTGKFPVHVKGASQGIHIKVNGSRDSNTVFVNFGDDINSSWGKIAGQTFEDWKANDLEENFRYSSDAKGLKIAELSSAVAAMVVTIGGAIATGIGIAESIALGLDMSAVVGELAFYLKYYAITVEEGAFYQGVTYSSGAADYAEYLELAPGQRKLEPGEVVGVKNGKVSLTTEGADHILAVSSLPIALGNLPKESEKARYEKIAFMGQVRVRVVGAVNIGDYILPSGNHDGLAMAVRPDKMRASDYANILGVAWSGSLAGPAYQFINVAIGINAFEMSRELVRLERQVKAIKAYLKGESPDFKVQEKENQLVTKAVVPTNVAEKKVEDIQKMSVETHARILDENKALVEQLFRNARSGLPADVREHPQIQAFLENPVPALKDMYRDPNGYLEKFAREAGRLSGK